MTSILFLIETNEWNQLRRNYLKNNKLSLHFFFFAFSKATLNFKHFQKKDDPHRWCILEITDSEKRG